QGNTFWLHNTNYLRLKNIELGYNLPDKAVGAMGLQAFRIYANALNLFTISPEKLIDPELTSGQAYPLQRIINLGLTITF
ncbi:MAG: TonB-dependent receptor, partial [Bacteroidales bacterium]|nr:TonB-dependent receptor [Bacteroidales bacterium]